MLVAVEAMEPLMEACLSKLATASTHLPPRPDLFEYYAEGVHRRFCNLCQVLLVRYDLDRNYLDTDGQAAPPSQSCKEQLEPSLMLALIGWAKRYEERMAVVGAGHGRQLLSPDANESLIAAYLHACRQLTRQWATNIVFCEQQTMVRKDEEAVATNQGGLTQGIITMSGEGGRQLWFDGAAPRDLFRVLS